MLVVLCRIVLLGRRRWTTEERDSFTVQMERAWDSVTTTHVGVQSTQMPHETKLEREWTCTWCCGRKCHTLIAWAFYRIKHPGQRRPASIGRRAGCMRKCGRVSQTNLAECVYSDSRHIYNPSPERHNPADDDETGALIITPAAATGVDAALNIVDAAACYNHRRHRRLLASNCTEIGSTGRAGRPASVATVAAASAAGNSDPACDWDCQVSNRIHFQLDTVAADFDRQVTVYGPSRIGMSGSCWECNIIKEQYIASLDAETLFCAVQLTLYISF